VVQDPQTGAEDEGGEEGAVSHECLENPNAGAQEASGARGSASPPPAMPNPLPVGPVEGLGLYLSALWALPATG